MESIIKDIKLAPLGEQKINWAKEYMPLMKYLGDKFGKSKIFKGINIVTSIHMEAKTAVFVLLLKQCGANVVATGCNPLSTQDDVAAALAKHNIPVFAKHGCNMKEYEKYLCMALDSHPSLIVDDGGDLVNLLHGKRSKQAVEIWGGSEETTTGVHRLHALAEADKLRFPMISVNDSTCKYLFDNRYGTGQSSLDGIIRTTNLIIAGKTLVVAGYGWCGKGICMRARGMGAKVVVTEIDPVKAIEAVCDGFQVMPMDKAAHIGDIFITVTGCKDVIRAKHMANMKDGAVLCNTGHFDVEINIPELEKLSVKKPYEVRKNITTYTLANGHKLNLLGQGRLVNLACADGHPIEIMDLSFAMQFMAMKYIKEHGSEMENKLYLLPEELDKEIAFFKLAAGGYKIDKLTKEQEVYLKGEY